MADQRPLFVYYGLLVSLTAITTVSADNILLKSGGELKSSGNLKMTVGASTNYVDYSATRVSLKIVTTEPTTYTDLANGEVLISEVSGVVKLWHRSGTKLYFFTLTLRI